MDGSEIFYSYLNSLDDEYYFFLANTVLGKVRTPFHKPVVNQSVLSFLKNEENKANILSSLDGDDRRYLSLIHLVGEASSSQIADFFDNESYPLVLTRLESLRDRLLLLRHGEFYYIDPVLSDVVQRAYDIDLALGEDKGPERASEHVDRNVLFAVMNLLSNGSVPPREANAHHFIKSNRLEKVFPQFSKERSLLFYTLLKELLVREGAIKPTAGRFLIERRSALRILSLDDLNLMINAIGESFGEAISSILGILKVHSLTRRQALCLVGFYTDDEHQNRILDGMESFGFITEDPEGIVRLNPAVLQPKVPRSALSVDSDLEVTYFGEPKPDDILYLFSDITVCDNLVRYLITKDSFTRALDLGLDRFSISMHLGTDRFDHQFEQWEEAFSRISLYDGITIRCNPQVASIVERHPKLKDHIIHSLGNGIFVMKRETAPTWQETLAYALDMAHLPVATGGIKAEATLPVLSGKSYQIMEVEGSTSVRGNCGSVSDLRAELIRDAQAKGCLTEDVKALIDARLIVSKSQLGKDFHYASMQTIGGFDYSAKLSAIRALLKSSKKKSPPLLNLELSDSTMLVQPVELVKAEGKDVVLKVRVLPDCQERGIPVSSIYKATVLRWTMA